MTTSTTKLLLEKINQYNTNPSSIQQGILDCLKTVLNGDDIVDPTSPFIFLMEAAATATAAAIIKSESVSRELYPRLALTEEELYHHISDKEFFNMFSKPSVSTINVLFPFDVLQAEAITLNNAINVKTVIVPKDTIFTVNNISLCSIYPIYINILEHDVVQVIYVNNEINTFLPLKSNLLKFNVVSYGGNKYLQVTIPVLQLNSISKIYALNSLTSFTQTIEFKDSFCYVKAYISKDKEWVEILTTHSHKVYDITKPTLKLKVIDNLLTINLPDIYQTKKSANYSLRVDVYTTLGDLDIDLSQINSNNFSVKWIDYDIYNKTNNPINKILDVIISSNDRLTGGSNSLSLEEKRERIIYRIDGFTSPIRLTDLKIDLEQKGYVFQKLIDSVTDRVFIASKNLPSRVIDGLSTSPLITNLAVTIDGELGKVGSQYRKSLLTHNDFRITVTPEAIYELVDNNTRLLTDSELTALKTLTGQQLCTKLNENKYFYSPFYYVIDFSQQYLTSAVYSLSPKVIANNYMDSNPKRNYNVRTINYTINLINDEYILELVASKTADITDLNCQITFFDKANGRSFYINGVASIFNSEVTFQFKFKTNFNINLLNEIEILNLQSNAVETAVNVNLTDKFNVIYYLNSSDDLKTNFDNIYFPNSTNVVSIIYETLDISFGKKIEGLYCPVKDILVAGEFVKYTTDVYATYNEIIYETNSLGRVYTIGLDGSVNFVIKHNIGDPILDGNGDNITIHRQGDFVLDTVGELIPVTGYMNGIKYILGVTVIDSKYLFATAKETKEYTDSIPLIIDDYINKELLTQRDELAERTELYYKPKGESSKLLVLIGDKDKLLVPSTISFKITYYLSYEGLNNEEILATIKRLTKILLSKHISKKTISVAELTAELMQLKVEQVKGFSIDEFLPDNLPIVTVVDSGKTFSIDKELVVIPDSSLDVVDKVDIQFKSLV
jgi:hypothetical protein